MASGDANRIWFPEIISLLKNRWNASMSWDEMIQIRNSLDETLQEIRTKRNIKAPMMWCPKCQTQHRSAPPKVSVRAMILALGRFNIENEEVVKTLERKWKSYQANNKLDLCGKPKE
jgi:hypothetical protein